MLIVRCVGAAPHRSPSGELRPSPALLFVRVALRCWWRSVAPSSFPPTIPSPGAALCSPGSLGSVPLVLSSYCGTPTSDDHRSLRSSLASRLSPYHCDQSTDLPSSWAAPCLRAVLFDPGGAEAHAVGTSSLPLAHLLLPSAFVTASATATDISRLIHTARMLAVYASPTTSPASTQDSLPAGGTPWPDETVRSGLALGSIRKFPVSAFPFLQASLGALQGISWARNHGPTLAIRLSKKSILNGSSEAPSANEA